MYVVFYRRHNVLGKGAYALRKKYRLRFALATLTIKHCTLCHMSMMKVPVFLSNNCFRSLSCAFFAGNFKEVFFRWRLIGRKKDEMKGVSSMRMTTKEEYILRFNFLGDLNRQGE